MKLPVPLALALLLAGCAHEQSARPFWTCDDSDYSSARVLWSNRHFDRDWRPKGVAIEWIEKQGVPRSLLIGGRAETSNSEIDLASTPVEFSVRPPDKILERMRRTELHGGSAAGPRAPRSQVSGMFEVTGTFGEILAAAKEYKRFYLVGLDSRGSILTHAEVDPAIIERAFHALSASLDRSRASAMKRGSKCGPYSVLVIQAD